ncbi:MAG TPA: membrane protein insertion efficiency factor YidD [Jiangellaceae bacterium]|nr:membrane protein insertion efficiency factor YidD [Jiangellaceae bacterium]
MMRRVLVALLKAYRLLISPLYGQTCRYYPTCSAYALGAVETHGALRGSWLAARRLGRCHPWTPGGVDLVPPREAYRWWGLVPGMDGSADDHDTTTTRLPRTGTPFADTPVARGA